MKKIKLFAFTKMDVLEEKVNEFCKDKKVIDISYQSFPLTTKYDKNGYPVKVEIVDRCLIVYESSTNDRRCETCRYSDFNLSEEPCLNCSFMNHPNWEEK